MAEEHARNVGSMVGHVILTLAFGVALGSFTLARWPLARGDALTVVYTGVFAAICGRLAMDLARAGRGRRQGPGSRGQGSSRDAACGRRAD